jgi:hypothetical protein
LAANPNPARVTDASWYFMESLLALEPGSRNGGTFTDKPGYHNTRDNLLAQGLRGDYSIQLGADKLGPGDKTAAYDWTFPSAQLGDYRRIIMYGERISHAFHARDPRLRGWREALGQADPDLYAEGFDFAGWYTRTPDPSHLWHWHLSEHRQHTGSYDNKRAMLSILRGQSLAEWRGDDMPVFIRLPDGAVWVSNGPTRYNIRSVDDLAEALAAHGKTVNDLRNTIAARLGAYGTDVGMIAKDQPVFRLDDTQLAALKAALGAPTAQQIEEAAFRGAQRAEDT